MLTIPEDPAKLVEIIRKAAHSNFSTGTKFMKYCNHKSSTEITSDEFYVFIKSFTRLERQAVDKVFLKYAVPTNKRVKEGEKVDISEMAIFESDLLKIYEDPLNRSKSRVLSTKKSQDLEKFKSIMDLSGLNVSGFGDGAGGDQGRGSYIEDKQDMGLENELYMRDDASNDVSEDNQKDQARNKPEKIEELILNISISTLDQIKYQNKLTKDLFYMFADKITRMMNFDEFSEAIKFICKDNFIEDDVLNGCYQLFAWPTSRKISLSKFQKIVDMGKKMNPLYIKVKKRYRGSMAKYKQLYRDELLKMDVKDGEGLVAVIDIIRLFKMNKIDVSEMDCEFLKEEGIIMMRDKTNLVEIRQFINKVFPVNSVFEEFVMNRSVSKIQDCFRRYKVKKLDLERQDAFMEMFMGGDSFDVSKASKRKLNNIPIKRKLTQGKGNEEENRIKKPAEIFEIAGGEKDGTPSLNIAKKKVIDKKIAEKMKAKLQGKDLAQDQISKIMQPRRTSILQGVNR